MYPTNIFVRAYCQWLDFVTQFLEADTVFFTKSQLCLQSSLYLSNFSIYTAEASTALYLRLEIVMAWLEMLTVLTNSRLGQS